MSTKRCERQSREICWMYKTHCVWTSEGRLEMVPFILIVISSWLRCILPNNCITSKFWLLFQRSHWQLIQHRCHKLQDWVTPDTAQCNSAALIYFPSFYISRFHLINLPEYATPALFVTFYSSRKHPNGFIHTGPVCIHGPPTRLLVFHK